LNIFDRCWSPVYVPEIETGRHVKNNACTVEIKIKWMIRKHIPWRYVWFCFRWVDSPGSENRFWCTDYDLMKLSKEHQVSFWLFEPRRWIILKARLHDQSLPSKTWSKFLTELLLKENFVKVIPFTQSKFGKSCYPKLPFCGKFKDKRYGKMVFILKRCFEWSIPIKVFF